MKFNVSYMRNEVPQTIFVEAKTAEIAESYFKSQQQDAQICGVHEATADDYRPGKPVMVVPDDYVGDTNDILKKYGLDKYHDSSFQYRMLDRMRSDCEYYLGNGNRYAKHLWAGEEKDHIALMKALWKSFPEDGKPEWLPYDKILEYEGQMCGIEVLFTFGSWEKYPFNMGYVSITAPSVKMAIEEFRRHYPDVNAGSLNCADYYYTEEAKAEIFEHGNGAGCHRKIVVESKDVSLDERLANATSRSAESGKNEVAKGDFGVEKE